MKYIGTTETYDPCFVPDWDSRLLEANIIISKELTDEMITKLVANKDRIIFHHTVTGFGGTQYEPNVKEPKVEFNQFTKLIDSGFPLSHYVLRVDPMIPINSYHLIASLNVLNLYVKYLIDNGRTQKLRVRVSIIDVYNHVRQRMLLRTGMDFPWSGFTAPQEVFTYVTEAIKGLGYLDYLEFESCAEHKFDSNVINKVGCISDKDLDILGIDKSDYGLPEKPQRSTCLCLAKKQILGVKPKVCPHNCIYCYWKS